MRSGITPQLDMALLETKQIQIVVNGQTRTVPEGRSLLELLQWLEVDASRVAVELDRSIIRREKWATSPIGPGATLEVVQFVGGG